MHEVNQQKYLVTWVERGQDNAPGLIRGQAAKTHGDAVRMYNHILTTGVAYAEVRMIGGLVRDGDRTLQYIQTEAENVQ